MRIFRAHHQAWSLIIQVCRGGDPCLILCSSRTTTVVQCPAGHFTAAPDSQCHPGRVPEGEAQQLRPPPPARDSVTALGLRPGRVTQPRHWPRRVTAAATRRDGASERRRGPRQTTVCANNRGAAGSLSLGSAGWPRSRRVHRAPGPGHCGPRPLAIQCRTQHRHGPTVTGGI